MAKQRDLLSLEPDPVREEYKMHVGRTLLRKNLKKTVGERILQMMDLQRFAEALRGIARRKPRS